MDEMYRLALEAAREVLEDGAFDNPTNEDNRATIEAARQIVAMTAKRDSSQSSNDSSKLTDRDDRVLGGGSEERPVISL